MSEDTEHRARACASRSGPAMPARRRRCWSRATGRPGAATRRRDAALRPGRLERADRRVRRRRCTGAGETDGLPEDAVLASLGCGNPLAVAELREGERVLDLGSGGGIDVLLSARRVGPSGFAYGVDMTDEMLDASPGERRQGRARRTWSSSRARSRRCRCRTPSVDVVISNCVINLSVDKPAVLRGDVPGASARRPDRHRRRGGRGPA